MIAGQMEVAGSGVKGETSEGRETWESGNVAEERQRHDEQY